MKRTKRLWAIALIVALVVTIAPFYAKSGKEVKAASFSITAPANNSLRPAGYIDIKWSAASGSVKEYEVYIDNAKVATTANTSYEWYSTKVVQHNLYVKAVFNGGGTENSATITFSVSKKGLGLASDMGRNVDLAGMGVAWYYNWGENPSSGNQYQGIDYIPMVWKETNANNFKNRVNNALNKGYKEILTFNEPDLNGQCNMSVNDVYNVWQGIDGYNGDIRISSPVTALWPKASGNWFQPFMSKLTGNDYQPDFISIHCYPDNYAGSGMANWFVTEVVDWAWDTYHLPIWVTEFSTTGNQVTATGGNGTKEFWETVMPLLDQREYVERYAAFGFNAASNPNCGLWNYGTGALTAGGEVYRDLGNPDGYDPGDIPDADYKTEIKTRNTLLDDTVTINGVTCTDYISQGGCTATASSEKDGNKASAAIDNDVESRWESVHGQDNQTFILDLGSSKKIKEVDIMWEGASASKYTISVSNDGNSYTEVATVESGDGARWDKTTLKQQATGRYIKIYCISRTTTYGFSIKDMAVYGSNDSKIDETTARPTTTRRPTTTTAKPTSYSGKTTLDGLNGALFNGYVAGDKANVAATFNVSSNGDAVINVSKGGDKWATPDDSIQAQYLNVAVKPNAETEYTAFLTSTANNKRVKIVVSDGLGKQIAEKTYYVQAGSEKYVYVPFTTSTDKVHIAYYIANTNAESFNDFTLTIKSNTITSKSTDSATEVSAATNANVNVSAPAKVKIAKIAKKKKSAKNLTVKIKTVSAKGYLVAVYKTKKNAKKNKKALLKKYINKNVATLKVKNKKLKGKKKLFVRVRAYNLKGSQKVFGAWSDVKKVKVK